MKATDNRAGDKRQLKKLGDEIAQELGEEHLTDDELLILALIVHRETGEPLSYEHCGKLLNITANAVKYTENKALAKLRKGLKKSGLDASDVED